MAKKLQLLFVINQFFKGGAEKALLAILKMLPENLFDIDLVVYDQQTHIDAISLEGDIPEFISKCVIHTAPAKSAAGFLQRLKKRFLFIYAGMERYHPDVVRFVQRKEYDLAISYGEWFPTDLVMCCANTRRRAVWLHGDPAQSVLTNLDTLFRYDAKTDFYICVSDPFRDALVQSFPFIKTRAVVVHNPVLLEDIIHKAEVEYTESDVDAPVLLSVGNFRPEKNYLRAVEAAALLKKRGVRFYWHIIGAFSHEATVEDVKSAIKRHSLEKEVKVLGKRDNPYCHMKHATLFVSTSDHESWSIVITEAKALKTPVVATRTVGASSQILDGVNGILTDFSGESLADAIERLLLNQTTLQDIKKRLAFWKTPDPTQKISELAKASSMPPTDLLYVIDDVNYVGGAHVATARQAIALAEQGKCVTVFSGSPPTIAARNRFAPVPIWDLYSDQLSELLARPLLGCLGDRKYTLKEKWLKLRTSLGRRLGLHQPIGTSSEQNALLEEFNKASVLCVMSEGSRFRELAAQSTAKYKVQWVHTNYAVWSRLTDQTIALTRNDGTLYSHFDLIVFISESSLQGFKTIWPSVETQMAVARNLMKSPRYEELPHYVQSETPRIITVARLEKEKDIPRMIRIAKRLQNEGIPFIWNVVGTSPTLEDLRQSADREGLSRCFILLGNIEDPFLLIRESELFALFSHYEGLPNTIFEAFMLGTPVIATYAAGGEQIEDGVNGILVEDDEDKIYGALSTLLQNPNKIARLRSSLASYRYDNDAVLEHVKTLFFPKEV